MSGLAQVEQEILAWHRTNELSQRLETIPGIGLITASALAATIPDPSSFRSGRHLAAWIGLVPRQSGTGGKVRLGHISKQGDRYLRRLLVLGASTLMRHARGQSLGDGRMDQRAPGPPPGQHRQDRHCQQAGPDRLGGPAGQPGLSCSGCCGRIGSLWSRMRVCKVGGGGDGVMTNRSSRGSDKPVISRCAQTQHKCWGPDPRTSSRPAVM